VRIFHCPARRATRFICKNGSTTLATSQSAGYNHASLGLVAQLVEQRIENPCVGGSIPPRATKNSAVQQNANPCRLAFLFVQAGRRAGNRLPNAIHVILSFP
jgi:hypothetical protein